MIDIKNLKFVKLIICGIYYLLYISNIVEKKKKKGLLSNTPKPQPFQKLRHSQAPLSKQRSGKNIKKITNGVFFLPSKVSTQLYGKPRIMNR